MIRFTHFTWGSGAGLVADLSIFGALVLGGASGARANIASTSVAITLTYVLVARFAFRVPPTWRTYGAFLAWYASSALLVSALIEVVGGGDVPVVAALKVCSVPVTFATNYLFSRWLFGGGAERLVPRSAGRPALRGTTAALAAWARRHRSAVLATGITVWYAVLVLPVWEGLAFPFPDTGETALRRTLLEALFLVALWSVALFLVRFARQVRDGSRRHRAWLVTAAAVLVANLLVLALIYPGYWVWDEFYVLEGVRAYSDSAWQGYLTNVYYTFCLYLIPSAMGIVVVQLLFASLVSGYVVSALRDRLSRPSLALICAVPMLSFVTLLNNTYPLRLTAYAYLLVLVLARLAVAWRARRPVTPAALLGFGVAVAILGFWRSEGIVLLALLPIYVVVGRVRRTLRVQRVGTALAALGVLAGVAASGFVTVSTVDPRYQMTAYINPLSTMLQRDLESDDRDADLAAIDRVIPLEALIEHPSYRETPALWLVGPRPGFEQHLAGMRDAYIDLVLHNPGPFLDNRWQAFLAANSMQADHNPQIYGGGVHVATANEALYHDGFAKFLENNPSATPIDRELRASALKALLLTDEPGSSPAGALVWNVLPVMAAVLAVLALASMRRRGVWAVCAGVVLTQATIVFLAEPASYFMYFFPAYLAGGLLVAAAAASWIDGALSRRQRVGPALVEAQAPERTATRELIDA